MSRVTKKALNAFVIANLEAENDRLRRRVQELETKDIIRLEKQTKRLFAAIADIYEVIMLPGIKR
jgi:hypothetical protein